jgi:CO/xanthine dehydrogenase FAD-binding subunit
MDLPAVSEIAPAQRAAVDRWRAGDAWLAGGTWLFSEPQPDLRRLMDLTALGWPALTAGTDGLEIAATCTLAQLAAYPVAPQWPAAALFAACCEALLGSLKVCNAATVGGNLCCALPAGPMIALTVGLDGICEVWSAGDRTRHVAAAELVTGPGETSLAPGELLRSITLPDRTLGCDTAFRQESLAPLGRSGALVLGRRSETGEVVITVTGAVPRPVQLRFDTPPGAAGLRDALTTADPEPYDDPHGDPRWRAHLIALLCEEVRAELQERA